MADLQQSLRDIIKPGFASQPVDVQRLFAIWLSAVVEEDATTARSLAASDHGKVLNFTSGSAVSVTVPPGLPVAFMCGIAQGGAGQVTLVEGSGVHVRNADSQLATEAQYVILSLIGFSTDIFWLSGRTA